MHIIVPDMQIFPRKIAFFLVHQFQHTLYVLVTQKNRLNETVLFSIHSMF